MPKYPFQPEILDVLPEELAELFRDLENTLLTEICSRLKASNQFNEVTVQDIRALRSHGIDLKEIKKAVRKTTGISEQKLNKLLNDVVERNQKYYTEVIDLAHVTQPETLVDAATIAVIQAQTLDTFRNMTASMGFLVDSGRTMLEPAKAYQWALDNAVMQVQSGAISYNQAIKTAVQQLAQSGVKVVDYESGHRDQIDVAARRAVMTGVNQICAKYTEQSAEYLNTPYFEVSAHAGARDKPKPSPWSSHKDWQGKVYSTRSNDIYPNIYEVCGLGYVDGLEGANCRHKRFSWVEGVSERTYTDEQLAHIDDGLGCTFDGRKYTAYEATQMQRRVERQIRAQKRLVNGYKAAGLTDDATVASIKLRRLNGKYREFSKAAGLPEQKERLKVLYGGQLANSKKFAPLKEYAGAWKIKDKFSDRQYIIDVGKPQISGAKQHFWDNLDTRPDRSGLNLDAAQDIINNSRLTLYQTDKSAIKFLSDNGYTVINMKKEVITVVPEKLRKKYRDYLEGK
nr:MAG TPA: minor capsid protein [Caudoviricetes sp.]DAQ96365.1 MAG TPA: minor capsid protein [Caudoviricetes sp.]